MHTVVETQVYLRAAAAIFDADERDAIVAMVSSDPGCGDLMPGTGGFRKVRVGRAGMGKRGGARVVYIVRRDDMPIFLMTAYAKNDKGNLTMRERNELGKMADELFATYRRTR